MHLQICAWILIFGVWHNTEYIKSIRHQTSDIIGEVCTERPCIPYLEKPPCYNNFPTRIKTGQIDEYVIRIANTESAGDYMPIRDSEIKISNTTQEYLKIKDFITSCAQSRK